MARPPKRNAPARPPSAQPPVTPGRAVTLRDVAKVAGVSAITVSRALSRPDLVTPATLEKVREVVSRTGYVPNVLAGSLKSRRSRIVAAVFPQITTTLFVDTIQALTDRLRQDGYQVLLGLSAYGEREDELVAGILGRRPDALFLTGIRHSPELRRQVLASRIPVVEAWDLSPSPIDMLVGFSHEAAGAAMARHLLSRGHREIGLAWSDDERAQVRRQGFLAALAEAGVAPAAEVRLHAPSSFHLGREGLSRLLAGRRRVRAIACSSDNLAQGAIAEAIDRGMAIPRDLAVMGFGDLEFAAYTTPALSTIGIDKAAIGRLAAEALLERLAGREGPQAAIDVGFEVLARAST